MGRSRSLGGMVVYAPGVNAGDSDDGDLFGCWLGEYLDTLRTREISKNHGPARTRDLETWKCHVSSHPHDSRDAPAFGTVSAPAVACRTKHSTLVYSGLEHSPHQEHPVSVHRATTSIT